MSAAVRGAGTALAVGSAVLHAFSIGHGVVASLVMLAMAVACLYCAAEVWFRDTDRAWVVVAVMNLAMIAVHLPMAGHHHGGAVASSSTGASAVMAVATVVAAAEAVLAAAVLARRSRGYSPGAPERT